MCIKACINSVLNYYSFQHWVTYIQSIIAITMSRSNERFVHGDHRFTHFMRKSFVSFNARREAPYLQNDYLDGWPIKIKTQTTYRTELHLSTWPISCLRSLHGDCVAFPRRREACTGRAFNCHTTTGHCDVGGALEWNELKTPSILELNHPHPQ